MTLDLLVLALTRINETHRRCRDVDGSGKVPSAAEILRVALAENPQTHETESTKLLLASAIGQPDWRLAVYGSLAPGESNHDQLATLEGSWEEGTVRGYLERVGWGQSIGFPGMRWAPAGGSVPVKLFTSSELPLQWRRLDDFEGSDYRRILVPVDTQRGVVVANLYELALP